MNLLPRRRNATGAELTTSGLTPLDRAQADFEREIAEVALRIKGEIGAGFPLDMQHRLVAFPHNLQDRRQGGLPAAGLNPVEPAVLEVVIRMSFSICLRPARHVALGSSVAASATTAQSEVAKVAFIG